MTSDTGMSSDTPLADTRRTPYLVVSLDRFTFMDILRMLADPSLVYSNRDHIVYAKAYPSFRYSQPVTQSQLTECSQTRSTTPLALAPQPVPNGTMPHEAEV